MARAVNIHFECYHASRMILTPANHIDSKDFIDVIPLQ
jgi:hypothetical protein